MSEVILSSRDMKTLSKLVPFDAHLEPGKYLEWETHSAAPQASTCRWFSTFNTRRSSSLSLFPSFGTFAAHLGEDWNSACVQ